MKTDDQHARDTFADLRSRLADYADRLTIHETESSLSITPLGADTFPIDVMHDKHEITISACRWHTHEDQPNEAIYCVMWLLTPLYRIVEEEKNGSWVKSRLERFMPPGQWISGDEVGTLPALFRPKRGVVRIARQQNVLPVPSAVMEQFAPGTFDESGLPIGSYLGTHVLPD